MNRQIKYTLAISLLIVGILISFTSAFQQYDFPIGPQKQTLGVATKIGCLPTTYSDEELIKNKLFIEKVIGVRTAYLCKLNG